MEKRRVYPVAKAKKLSSAALISMLKGMDIEVKSHMSVVTPEMLEAIDRKIKEEKKSSIEELKRQKASEDSRKLFNKLMAWGLSMTLVGSVTCWFFFTVLRVGLG